jgi:hypothetical protein
MVAAQQRRGQIIRAALLAARGRLPQDQIGKKLTLHLAKAAHFGKRREAQGPAQRALSFRRDPQRTLVNVAIDGTASDGLLNQRGLFGSPSIGARHNILHNLGLGGRLLRLGKEAREHQEFHAFVVLLVRDISHRCSPESTRP